jgi:hypothetical protein
MRKVTLAIAWLVSLVVVAGLASNAALKNQLAAFGIELDKTQAMLAFNHMDRYRELESDLSKGCYVEAIEKAKISKDQELSLLSSFFKAHPDEGFQKYVLDRDPAVAEQLKTFKSAYGDTWTWPKCSK